MPLQSGQQNRWLWVTQTLKRRIIPAALLGISGSVIILAISGCASPQVSAFSPTQIPTLAPATLPQSQIEPTGTPALLIESFPAGVPQAASGLELYSEYCTECHGVDGNGQVPNARNFGDVDYMRGETPLDFYLAITEGVAGLEDVEYEMPAFGDVLSSDERWDLVYYVWRFSTSQDRLNIGREIFTSFCEECHGEEGRSQILNAADLSDQRFIAHQSPSALYLSVTRGRESMPAWQARLNQDERWMVIEYLRTFSYDPQLPEPVTAEVETVAVDEDQTDCDPSYLSQTNPFEWDDATAISAAEPVYLDECEACHGLDGTGEIAAAPDFTNPAFRGDLLDNAGQYLCSVAEGRNRMPSYVETLSESEMWQLLTYIAALDG